LAEGAETAAAATPAMTTKRAKIRTTSFMEAYLFILNFSGSIAFPLPRILLQNKGRKFFFFSSIAQLSIILITVVTYPQSNLHQVTDRPSRRLRKISSPRAKIELGKFVKSPSFFKRLYPQIRCPEPISGIASQLKAQTEGRMETYGD
jgi:hypothetical protein